MFIVVVIVVVVPDDGESIIVISREVDALSRSGSRVVAPIRRGGKSSSVYEYVAIVGLELLLARSYFGASRGRSLRLGASLLVVGMMVMID